MPARPRVHTVRASGLRREGIAVEAHISTEYYAHLEQGRTPVPPRRSWRESPTSCA
ncbi:helix-turn-helix domain-containing protein [Streptomyces parvulus]|uniref:helix-turn-helix domain-containing protein n=1 Tax=Streptomyces parvulus TaxID=146923 RepID=UPI003F4E3567